MLCRLAPRAAVHLSRLALELPHPADRPGDAREGTAELPVEIITWVHHYLGDTQFFHFSYFVNPLRLGACYRDIAILWNRLEGSLSIPGNR